MELEEKAEEILEKLWINARETSEDSLPLDGLEVSEKEAVEQLLAVDYLSVAGNRVRLTEKGYPAATDVVRRHRLAERLLMDVLGVKEMLTEEKACKFEHLLDRGLDESICILLGHPKICPHGKLIPPGRCCQEDQIQVQKVVAPLSQLSQGEKGKVAYIYAPEAGKLQKLIAMGILPGAAISLIQGFPSYVFQVGQTQFAVDREIAESIYVRRVEEEEGNETRQPTGKHRGRFGLW